MNINQKLDREYQFVVENHKDFILLKTPIDHPNQYDYIKITKNINDDCLIVYHVDVASFIVSYKIKFSQLSQNNFVHLMGELHDIRAAENIRFNYSYRTPYSPLPSNKFKVKLTY